VLIPEPITAPVGTIAVAMCLGAAMAGCGGDGEPTFGAEEFVEAANRNGAGLELGEPLTAAGGEGEIYGVSLRSPPGGDGGGEPEHGGGSLRVTDSTQAAEEEHARCEGAASLLCFRAANVVVILEDDVHPAGLARLTDALRAMESG
jgi:hypothetical protein